MASSPPDLMEPESETRWPKLGAEVEPGGVRYRVWAPAARTVEVEILSATGSPERSLQLDEREPGFFSALDAEGAAGNRYRLRLDRDKAYPDPWSRWQPEGVHGASMVVDGRQYPWQDNAWRRPEFRDLVIYELHVGTFTKAGTFLAAIERLRHIQELGANAIELMPVADFAGSRNWGYDGVCWYAPSRAYGHPDDLRRLVDAAHGMGLTVILDVVYNHLGPDGNYLGMFAGDIFDAGVPTPWGGALKYAAASFKTLRQMVVANPAYWMREFHIDGFRLDATHAIVDASERHVLQELTENIHALGGFAVAEDSRNDARVLEPVAQGGMAFDAVWADDFHHAVRVMNTHEEEGYFADFQGSLAEVVAALKEGWIYTGQKAKSLGRPRGTPGRHLPPERFIHCISNHDQTGNQAFGERFGHRVHPAALHAAAGLLCLSPCTPMLFMGQEWRASSPFLFFTDHHAGLGRLILEGRRAEFRHFTAFSDPAAAETLPNPQAEDSFTASKLKWEEIAAPGHAATLRLYQAFLSLRRDNAAFRPRARDTWAVRELPWGAGLLTFRDAENIWAVIFDLQGGHAGSLAQEPEFAGSATAWEVVLSTQEERFGGSGQSGVDPTSLAARFNGPETVVLRAANT